MHIKNTLGKVNIAHVVDIALYNILSILIDPNFTLLLYCGLYDPVRIITPGLYDTCLVSQTLHLRYLSNLCFLILYLILSLDMPSSFAALVLFCIHWLSALLIKFRSTSDKEIPLAGISNS